MYRGRRPLFLCCSGAILVTAAVAAQNVSFFPHKDLPFGNGSSCCSVVSGDFNGDGKLDLVVGDLQAGLTVLLGDGTGNFVAKNIGVIGPNAKVIAASDLNKDGKLDLLIVAYPTSGYTTYALLGNGDGTFKKTSSVSSDELKLVADFNGDGIPDLLFLAPQVSGFYVRLGNGDGTFRPPAATANTTRPFLHSVAVGDLNGDGIPDVVWSHAWHDGGIDVWLGNGDGTFQLQPGIVDASDSYGRGDSYGTKPMVIADFNHDGRLDLAVFMNELSAVVVLAGNGDGTFRRGFSVPVLGGGGVVAADFNGDGHLDLASGPAVLLGNGDGTFQAPAYFPYGHPYSVVAVAADLSGRGRPDLVLSPGFGQDPSPAISLLFNDSPGNPASVAAVSAATGAAAVSPASLASIYGTHLAATTAIADSGTWPEELGGIRLRIRDSSNITRSAQLIYVSPTQINFLVPDGVANGWSIMTIDNGATPLVEGTRATAISDISPGFFTVDGHENGVAAASAVRILADGKQQPVDVFSCKGSGPCVATPIDLSSGAVYLSLYGTGFRRVGVNGRECNVSSGTSYPRSAFVTFSGPQPAVPGLDQVNMLLPSSLPPGPAVVQCSFVGNNSLYFSNNVQITIR